MKEIPERIEDTSYASIANAAVWAVNNQQEILFWNEEAEKMFGREVNDVIGKNCFQVINGEDFEGKSICQKNCLYQSSNISRNIWRYDILVFHRNERKNTILLRSMHLGNEDPEKSNIIHIAKENATFQISECYLSIFLLGPLKIVRSDGSNVEGSLWNRSKVRSLMAYLTFNLGKRIHREKLIEIFWPKFDYRSALANLNTTIYNLRHCINPKLSSNISSEFVQYEQDHYFLSKGASYWIDYHVFELKALLALQECDPKIAIEKINEAVSFYRGDFLEDLILSNSWALQEQMRLSELYFRCKQKLGDCYIAVGQQIKGINVYTQILSADPCREDVVEKIIMFYLKQGNRPMAMRYYTLLKSALAESCGLSPKKVFDEYL